MAAVRILLVDDVEEVRRDLRLLLDLTNDFEIIGEASNGLEAIHKAKVLQPEVVLMDLEMPVLDGYEAAAQIKMMVPNCRIVALTVHDYPGARQKSLKSGFDAFVVKGEPFTVLTQAILKIRKELP